MEFVEHLRVADPPMVGDGESGVTPGPSFLCLMRSLAELGASSCKQLWNGGDLRPQRCQRSARLRRMERPAGLEPATP